MENLIFAVEKLANPLLPIKGSEAKFPVRRVYCVGRNYADHAKEMGQDPANSKPIFFMKPTDSVVLASVESSCKIKYPPQTTNLHHEIELVIAIGDVSSGGGENLSAEDAGKIIFGLGVGVDLTRRDLQAEAKKKGQPWELAKGFDHSAPMSELIEMAEPLKGGRIWLSVDGTLRQDGDIKDMIWGVSEVVSILSSYYRLMPGDIIFTGTPAGVGALTIGQHVSGGVDGVGELAFDIV
jgi:fumarylpyruvate hydrolase